MQIDPAFHDRIAQLILQSRLMWVVAIAALLLLCLLAYRSKGRLETTRKRRSASREARRRAPATAGSRPRL